MKSNLLSIAGSASAERLAAKVLSIGIYVMFAMAGLLAPQIVCAKELTTIEQLCHHYVGKSLGIKNGQKVEITCDNIHVAERQSQAAMPKPLFRAMRDSLRKHREVDFEMLLLNDPSFKGKCTRDRKSRAKKYRCNFPPDADAVTEFTLNQSNQIEKAEVRVSRAIIRPATLNILAQLGISEATPAYSEIVLYLVAIKSRQLSFPDELYSTDGQTLQVEMWPWRQP